PDTCQVRVSRSRATPVPPAVRRTRSPSQAGWPSTTPCLRACSPTPSPTRSPRTTTESVTVSGVGAELGARRYGQRLLAIAGVVLILTAVSPATAVPAPKSGPRPLAVSVPADPTP